MAFGFGHVDLARGFVDGDAGDVPEFFFALEGPVRRAFAVQLLFIGALGVVRVDRSRMLSATSTRPVPATHRDPVGLFELSAGQALQELAFLALLRRPRFGFGLKTSTAPPSAARAFVQDIEISRRGACGVVEGDAVDLPEFFARA